jgi:hypothetical protein
MELVYIPYLHLFFQICWLYIFWLKILLNKNNNNNLLFIYLFSIIKP